VKLPAFEAEAVARPEKVVNPVDLGTILPPADWLLLAGGQKAEVEVAALRRIGTVASSTVRAWYQSAPAQRVQVALLLSQGRKVQTKLVTQAASTSLKHVTFTAQAPFSTFGRAGPSSCPP
jgi:hypothetical protein